MTEKLNERRWAIRTQIKNFMSANFIVELEERNMTS